MYLAIDTSTETASLALWSEGKTLAELNWRAGISHTGQTLSNLHYLLELLGIQLRAIEGVIVAKGPGSFNGLRVGMSIAKGLSLSLEIPITSVSTLEVEAYPHALASVPVCSLLDIGRGEVAAALFVTVGQEWQRLWEERIITVEKLCSELPHPIILCGRLHPLTMHRLQELVGPEDRIVAGAAALRRGGYLAELGAQRLARGQREDPAALQPLYLRRPHITGPRAKEEL